jgi:MerR family copper efflux transcriptional regulator
VAADTIRFYEKQGLRGKPPRTAGGYRSYHPGTVRVSQLIARAKHLGFTLREVKHLLWLHRGTQSTRADFRTLAREKLADIEARIAGLTRMRDALQPLVTRCDGVGPLAGCPVVGALTEDGRVAASHPQEG